MKGLKRYAFLVVLSFMIVGLLACAKETRKPSGIMDTPRHHYKQGISYLNQGELDKADQEFVLALELNPEYGPAISGKGLVLAMKGNASRSLELIKEGQGEAENKEEKIWTIVAEIRAYTALKKLDKLSRRDLVKASEKAFSKGVEVDPEAPSLHFYQGRAYLQALHFGGAVGMFAKVKGLESGFEQEAERLWRLVQKAERAAPETTVGKKIVLVDKLSRADMAGLLVEELNAERFYSKTQTPEKSSFKEPKGIAMKEEELYTKLGVTDIDSHPLRADIGQAIVLGIKGLQPYPDHTFRPQEHLSRAEVAMIFEDVIIRATGKEELATKFVGKETSFPDVRNDLPYFNAVMLCSSRGLLEGDLRSGLFRPMEPIPGVDALDAVLKLKRQLRVFD